MALSVGGGLDVASLVQQLVAVERAPAQRWNALRLTALSQQTAWTDIGAKLGALRTAAEGLDTGKEVATSAATSSDDKVMTATSSNGAVVGSTRVRVTALAVAQQFVSGGISAPSATVGAGRAVISSGTGPTGLGSPTVSSGVPAGRHVVTVHPPQPPVITGTAPVLDQLQSSFGFTLSVGGGPAASYTVPTPSKPYASVSDLAAAVQTSLQGVATVTVVDGKLKVAGLGTGPGESLAFGSTGSETALGLAGTQATGTGVQASLDGGPRADVAQGQPVTLLTATGSASSVSFTPVGTPRVGTVALNVVDTSAGATVADLTAALNAAGSPVAATLVDSGSADRTAPHHLALSASGAGTAGAYAIDTSGHAGFAELLARAGSSSTAAGDAQLVVGGNLAADGTITGGLTVTRSSNTVTDLLPGVTLSLAKTGDVTVGVTRDQAALTTKTKGMVEALNNLLSSVASQTRPGADGARGGPLAGSATARGVAARLFSVGSGTPASGTVKALSQLGIEVTREGRYKLDEAKLTQAVKDDPEGVAGLLASYATRVVEYAKQLGGSDGSIASSGRAAGAQATSRQKQMDALDKRLETVERRYTAQYAKLNATMSILNGQSSQLSSQISSMYY